MTKPDLPARLAAVPFTSVTIDDRFWAPRMEVNRTQTIPACYKQCKDTGRIDAFRLGWKPGMPNPPHIFWDSDVAKWIEAASYSLAAHPDRQLDALLDDCVALIAKAQRPDGYLNVHFTVVEPEKRFTNLRDWHELYCAGHLIEAAVAYFQATGKRTLLDVLCRYADHIAGVFGTGPGQKRGYPGHEEIELALVKLYRATGQEKYLRLAKYFIDERGRQPHYYDQEATARGEDPRKWWARSYEYCQAHVPVRQQTQIVGHAVRAMYLYSAMADLAAETGDTTLYEPCQGIWRNLTGRRTYITGGIGPSRQNEGFTFDYDLPNETAYAETCAAVGLVFWNHRMLQVELDGRYADAMERALYNGVISGVSLDGRRFFYENPLASVGNHHRQDWFGCACCPPNLARLQASIGGYICSAGADQAAIHLYVQSTARVRVGRHDVTLRQETDYPWDGAVRVTVRPDRPGRFALKLRQPAWCPRAKLSLGDKPVEHAMENGYLVLDRQWQGGETVELDLPMPVTAVYANPRVGANCWRVALQRGPLVYCLEGADNGKDLAALAISPADVGRFRVQPEPELLGGVVTIQGPARRLLDADWGDDLYRSAAPAVQQAEFKAIPYYAWDNRQPGEMIVWLRQA